MSERITRWLEIRDMTQADLARATKRSTAAVSQWITGATEPTLDSIEAICDAFEITVVEFWGDPRKKARAS